jgi:hypothetical protein
MPPSPLNPATTRHRRALPSVSVVIPVRDPAGLPLTLRGLPPVDEVIVVTESPAYAPPGGSPARHAPASARDGFSPARDGFPGPTVLGAAGLGATGLGATGLGAAGLGATPSDTASIVRAARPDALVLRGGRPGPGNALATGLAAAGGDVVVILNGDGSTDPAEIPHYIAALTAGADVAVGSRYREGGRDLTGGRFRRWLNLFLIWVVNTVFGTRRTDPGFGYAAFWRDALGHLELPDPSSRSAAGWGDGPEMGLLLGLRPSVRGLKVTEVSSVAYPRMSRPARAERPGVTHWLRLLTTEFPHRRARRATDSTPRPETVRDGFLSRAGSTRPDGSAARPATAKPTDAPRTAAGPTGAARNAAAGPTGAGRTVAPGPTDAGWTAADPTGAGRTAAAGPTNAGRANPATPDTGLPGWASDDRLAGTADVERPGAARQPAGEPIWGPPRRQPSPPRDLWLAGENPQPHTSPRSIANVTPHAWRGGYPGAIGPDAKPRSGEDARPDSAQARSIPPQPPAPREVGARRRRLEGYRQRPDLRVINGEGNGTERTRSGRLRPVPRENLGG